MTDPYQSPNVDPTAYNPNLPLASAQSGVPKVFGILHIIYAVIGGCTGLLNLASPLLVKTAYAGVLEKSGGNPALQAVIDKLVTISMIDGASRLILAIILLIAGIQLLKRKASGAKLSKMWAVIRMIIAVPLVYLTVTTQVELMSVIANAASTNVSTASNGVGIGLGIVILCIYPLVTLIFMSQATVKNSLTQ